MKTSMITTYEKGREQERRNLALLQLEAKFGPLADAVKQRVATIPPDELLQIMLEYYKAQSLKELRLED